MLKPRYIYDLKTSHVKVYLRRPYHSGGEDSHLKTSHVKVYRHNMKDLYGRKYNLKTSHVKVYPSGGKMYT